ncbi:hypothetical protein SASPL_118412 [Salvia splendens]|uniref:Homeobox protein knotted-1-like 1 n=1 Tax=Salvia splendens TaxID=180675 RepID=A0A8X8XXA7_SALSN|nr:homeobox protein knotted-1-like 1 [Salvia splendens]KAG6421853.1 hypothetical protein SASPL_118412 [Salvia splendens]
MDDEQLYTSFHYSYHTDFDGDQDLIKARIANHPLYPTLLSSYIDCTKVGAPPEMASLLEQIRGDSNPIFLATHFGTDPELDSFMRSYCESLRKYKEELSKPFDEARSFLSSIGSQLTHLCNQNLPSTTIHSTHEDKSCGEVVEGCGSMLESGDHELKEMLMRKYSGFVSNLRKEMLKKKKKGKLPKDAISALLEWWNTHYRWPYPTEEEKKRLSEMTGLEQQQINNWFINQRKRHWRPSHDMRSALIQDVTHTDDA